MPGFSQSGPGGGEVRKRTSPVFVSNANIISLMFSGTLQFPNHQHKGVEIGT